MSFEESALFKEAYVYRNFCFKSMRIVRSESKFAMKPTVVQFANSLFQFKRHALLSGKLNKLNFTYSKNLFEKTVFAPKFWDKILLKNQKFFG